MVTVKSWDENLEWIKTNIATYLGWGQNINVKQNAKPGSKHE